MTGLLSLLLVSCQPASAPHPEAVATDAPAASPGLLRSEGGEGEVIARAKGVQVTGPDYGARARAAWGAVESTELTSGAIDTVRKVGSIVAVDVPGKLHGLPEGTPALDLSISEEPRALLFGTDEAAAAAYLRKAGVSLLIVRRSLAPSFDRTSQVLSRLYHHDALDHFQLARVEADALMYLVVDAPLDFDEATAKSAMVWVRQRLSGQNPAAYPPTPAKRSEWRLVASLRGQGQELAFSLAQAPTLDKALIEVVDDLETMYRRQREILGFPRIDLHMPNLILELHRITEMAYVVPRDDGSINGLWEMGVDGVVMLSRPTDAEKKAGKKGQSAVWPGDVATTRSITRGEAFLKAAAREFRWDSVRPWRDEGVELNLIRTRHWIEASDGSVVRLERGTAPMPLSTVSLDATKASILAAGEWYLANLTPEGQVTYKFWPEENRYSDEYNHVRHTLATWNLWQAWTLDPRPEFLEGAQRAQRWTLTSLVERDETGLTGWEREAVEKSPLAADIKKNGMAYFTHGGNTKLGSVVVGLLGMIEVARATGDHGNDALMRKLGRFVMFMQEPSGTFRGYHVPTDHPYAGQVNDIVPGEAALSLVYLAEYFKDPQYLEPLPKFWAYYQPWFEQREAKRVAGGVWPMNAYPNDIRLELVQFGPWTVMAADAYTRVRPEATDVATFGLRVARWMIDTYEYTSERTPYPDYVGGYYKFEGELPAMQAFCYAEGTAAAYAMALRQKPEEASYFERHTRESIRFGFLMQHDALDTYPYSRPLQVFGGVGYAMNEPKVRIDYVHHALSAMYQWLIAARTDPALPAEVKAAPDAATQALLALQGMPGYRKRPLAAPGVGAGFSAPPAGGGVVAPAADQRDDGDDE